MIRLHQIASIRSGRPIGRLASRAALLAATASILLLTCAVQASAADITIIGPRGAAPSTVSLQSLASHYDVDDEYLVRAPNSATKVHVRGISLAALLKATGADPVYGGIKLTRADGTSFTLSKAQIVSGSQMPVVWADTAGVHVLRPSYAIDDYNAADHVVVAGPLVLTQTNSSSLTVSARASKSKYKVGERVRLSATVTGGGAGEVYEYSWNFDDGRGGDGRSVTHRFKRAGQYKVLVTVKTHGSGRSDPDVVTVQVGEPKESDRKRSGGGSNEAAGAPDSGAANGRHGAAGTERREAAPARPAKQTRRHHQRPERTARLSGLTVTGRLLGEADGQVIRAVDVAARSGNKAVKRGTSATVPDAAPGAAGVAGLLGLGALLELGLAGGLRRRLP